MSEEAEICLSNSFQIPNLQLADKAGAGFPATKGLKTGWFNFNVAQQGLGQEVSPFSFITVC